MSTAVIVMVAVMAFASIGMMFIAIIEFVMYMRNSRKDQQPVFITAPIAAQPEPVKEPEPAPAPAPAPEAEEVVVVEEADENSVTFELAEAHRPTIKEAYEGLKKIEQELYDRIRAHFYVFVKRIKKAFCRAIIVLHRHIFSPFTVEISVKNSFYRKVKKYTQKKKYHTPKDDKF